MYEFSHKWTFQSVHLWLQKALVMIALHVYVQQFFKRNLKKVTQITVQISGSGNAATQLFALLYGVTYEKLPKVSLELKFCFVVIANSKLI